MNVENDVLFGVSTPLTHVTVLTASDFVGIIITVVPIQSQHGVKEEYPHSSFTKNILKKEKHTILHSIHPLCLC